MMCSAMWSRSLSVRPWLPHPASAQVPCIPVCPHMTPIVSIAGATTPVFSVVAGVFGLWPACMPCLPCLPACSLLAHPRSATPRPRPCPHSWALLLQVLASQLTCAGCRRSCGMMTWTLISTACWGRCGRGCEGGWVLAHGGRWGTGAGGSGRALRVHPWVVMLVGWKGWHTCIAHSPSRRSELHA